MKTEFTINYVDNPEESAWASSGAACMITTKSRQAKTISNASVLQDFPVGHQRYFLSKEL